MIRTCAVSVALTGGFGSGNGSLPSCGLSGRPVTVAVFTTDSAGAAVQV